MAHIRLFLFPCYTYTEYPYGVTYVESACVNTYIQSTGAGVSTVTKCLSMLNQITSYTLKLYTYDTYTYIVILYLNDKSMHFSIITKIITKIDKIVNSKNSRVDKVVGILVNRKVDPGMRTELVMAQASRGRSQTLGKGLHTCSGGGVFFLFFFLFCLLFIFIGILKKKKSYLFEQWLKDGVSLELSPGIQTLQGLCGEILLRRSFSSKKKKAE